MASTARLILIAAASATVLAQPAPNEVTPWELQSDSTLIGKELTVVGRVGVAGTTRIRLKKCEVDFQLSGVDAPRTAKTDGIGLTGTLARQGTRLIFTVVRIKVLPGDAEVFKQRFSAAADDHTALYALGRWAQERGRFYDDEELTALARTAFDAALAGEEAAITEMDFAGMFALAQRAAELGASTATVQRIEHTAYRRRLAQIRDGDARAFEQLATDLAADLAGCDEPTKVADRRLVGRYIDDPAIAYRTADSYQRRKLHRALWAEITEAKLQAEWKIRARDGFDLADEADRVIPERPVGDRLRRQTLERESAAPGELSRRRVLTLAQHYRNLNNAEAAGALLLAWLEAQRRQLGKRDAAGRIELAGEYLRLGGDDPSGTSPERLGIAQQLLRDAWKLAPSPDLAQKLTRAGLVRDTTSGEWLKREEFERSEQGVRQQLIRQGQIGKGMTGQEVLQSRGRRPDAVTRIVTRTGITEQWIYETQNTQTLYINLEFARTQGGLLVTSYYVSR